MKSCSSCYWCQFALTGLEDFKCSLRPATIRFNHPKFHGWFCDNYIHYDEAIARIEEQNKEEGNGE